ncbi:MAG TPA: hypothetical protein VHO50_13450 [Bacteroidales bacterium]|nr:hypothetical protein [Bacteroidales bacterium]
MDNNIVNLRQKIPWFTGDADETINIPGGDLPGENVVIGLQHIRKTRIILPGLLNLLSPVFDSNPYHRAVVAVCGGSGAGKSGISSLISFYLNSIGIGSYTLCGDNYPHRIPKYNDAERLRTFRKSGLDQLISSGLYSADRFSLLNELQKNGKDSDPSYTSIYPWLGAYQQGGRNGLRGYLGTGNEIDFEELGTIISKFKNGDPVIYLKRMGREETNLWYEAVKFNKTNILVIDWTHGNSNYLNGVDIPVLLNSTPSDTLEYRKSRNRDKETDSSFTTMVLEIEQDLLISQASKAKIIISRDGEILTCNEFLKLMKMES